MTGSLESGFLVVFVRGIFYVFVGFLVFFLKTFFNCKLQSEIHV